MLQTHFNQYSKTIEVRYPALEPISENECGSDLLIDEFKKKPYRWLCMLQPINMILLLSFEYKHSTTCRL